jgi:transcription elongation factor Elf1
MYRQQSATDPMKSAECPKCNSKRLMLKGGKLSCTNCGEIIGTTFNKYGAKRTVFNGKLYDSKFEASVASELETRKRAKDIRDYETQYPLNFMRQKGLRRQTTNSGVNALKNCGCHFTKTISIRLLNKIEESNHVNSH